MKMLSKHKAKVTFLHGTKLVKVSFTLGQFEVTVDSTKSNKTTGYEYFNTLKECLDWAKKVKLTKQYF